jgi:uncharacterized membrane protein YedE/YeeE
MSKHAALFVPGVIFAAGLAISGMTNPAKVIGFLDLAGDWDPSLAFVMVGAIGAFAVLNVLVQKRPAPLLWGKFPGIKATGAELDGRLFLGATLFGIGWGVGGFCPGPAIANVSRFTPDVLAFVVAMVIGMVVAQQVFGLDKQAP